MKRFYNIIAVIFLVLVVKTGVAQQIPSYNLYNHGMFMINPANTGDSENMQALFDSHKKWSGVQGAPVTSTFAIHDSFSEKVGLGLKLTSDKAAMLERLSGSLNYSYKLRISKEKKHSLTFGLGLGFIENKINFDGLIGDPTDLLVSYGNYDGFAFDANFGFKYNLKGLEIGAAIPHLLDNKVTYARNGYDDYNFEMKRHYLIYGGYKFKLHGHEYDENMNKVKSGKEMFYLMPSILYKTDGLISQMDLNLVAGNAGGQWIGFTARPSNKSYVISAGLTVKGLGIGYAYQIANTELTMNSNGTHEILLTYTFSKSVSDNSELNNNIMDMMENQQNLKSQIDKLNNQLNSLKNEEKEQPSGQLEKLEEELKAEIDSLRAEMKKRAVADTSVVIVREKIVPAGGTDKGTSSGVTPSGSAAAAGASSQELDEIKAELDKLKQYVMRVQGENVVELETVTGDDNQETIVERPVKDGCYVIIYSFRRLDYAQRAVKMTGEKGITSNILYNKDRKWYYIYTDFYKELQPALEKMRETRKGEYDDSWVHIYKQ